MLHWRDVVLRLANPRLEVDIDPERGADILVVRRPGGPNVLATYDWQSPLRASRSVGYGDLTTDWLSEYRGGWQELFPNAGAACEVLGVPLPFHGEVSTARWDVTDATSDAVTLTTPTRLPLILERRMRLATDSSTLYIEETVRLDADMPVPFLWGHHPAFTATSGARIDMPEGITAVADDGYATEDADLTPGGTGSWPRLPGRAGGAVEVDAIGPGPTERLAYLSGFDASGGWTAIRGVAEGLGVAMAWDAATFPHAWFWWEIAGPGHPWHGRSRIVAVEPHTAVPSDGLAAAVARGEAHILEPGRTHQTWLTISLFDADARPVQMVARDGSVTR
jgi:galactose mutarotase-like enzyme